MNRKKEQEVHLKSYLREVNLLISRHNKIMWSLEDGLSFSNKHYELIDGYLILLKRAVNQVNKKYGYKLRYMLGDDDFDGVVELIGKNYILLDTDKKDEYDCVRSRDWENIDKSKIIIVDEEI